MLPGSTRFAPDRCSTATSTRLAYEVAGAQVEAAGLGAAVAGVVGAAVVLEDRLLDEVEGGGEGVALGLHAVAAAAVAVVVVAVVALLAALLHAVAAHRRRGR